MQWHFEAVWRYFPFLLAGTSNTLIVTSVSMLGGLLIGLIAALARMSRFALLRWITGFYIDLFRSTPLLTQLIWAYFALPILLGHALAPLQAATGVLSLHAGAYLAEIYRAGILSISSGQRYGGLALGMTNVQVTVRVILPQAVTRMLPPITSTLISLVKESSLISVISVTDLMWHATSLVGFTMRPLEVLTVTAMLYFILTYPLSLALNYMHRKHLAA